jgi:hypothetical protein
MITSTLAIMRKSATALRTGMLPVLLTVAIVTSILFGHPGVGCSSLATGPSVVASGHVTHSDTPSGDNDDACHCQHSAPTATNRTHRETGGHLAAIPARSGAPAELCVDTGHASPPSHPVDWLSSGRTRLIDLSIARR